MRIFLKGLDHPEAVTETVEVFLARYPFMAEHIHSIMAGDFVGKNSHDTARAYPALAKIIFDIKRMNQDGWTPNGRRVLAAHELYHLLEYWLKVNHKRPRFDLSAEQMAEISATAIKNRSELFAELGAWYLIGSQLSEEEAAAYPNYVAQRDAIGRNGAKIDAAVNSVLERI